MDKQKKNMNQAYPSKPYVTLSIDNGYEVNHHVSEDDNQSSLDKHDRNSNSEDIMIKSQSLKQQNLMSNQSSSDDVFFASGPFYAHLDDFDYNDKNQQENNDELTVCIIGILCAFFFYLDFFKI